MYHPGLWTQDHCTFPCMQSFTQGGLVLGGFPSILISCSDTGFNLLLINGHLAGCIFPFLTTFHTCSTFDVPKATCGSGSSSSVFPLVMAHAFALIGGLDSDSHLLTLCSFSFLVPHDCLCANVAHCCVTMGELHYTAESIAVFESLHWSKDRLSPQCVEYRSSQSCLTPWCKGASSWVLPPVVVALGVWDKQQVSC